MCKFWLAGAVFALSACGGGGGSDSGNADANVNSIAPENNTFDQNVAVESQVNAAAANGSIDANTQAAMQKDATTHDHDTNLANGT
jgi:hypothetical protein